MANYLLWGFPKKIKSAIIIVNYYWLLFIFLSSPYTKKKSSIDIFQFLEVLEAVVQKCSVKKVFLEIAQNSQENTCARVSF